MALTSAQIASVLQIESEVSLITGSATIIDISNYSSIGINPGDIVKVLLWIQDPTNETFYKNPGYDAANFSSPDLLPLTSPTSYSFTLPTVSTGAYMQGEYKVNMKVQVIQGVEITEGYRTRYMNVCGCCNGIVPDVRGEVSYNTAIVSVTDFTNYKTWTSLQNVVTLYPPTNTGSPQSGTFNGSPATLVYDPPLNTFPYTGMWQWTLVSDVGYTDSLTQTTTVCRLTAQGSFEVTQSELCKVRCLLDKYRTEVYAQIAVKANPNLEKNYLFAEADFLMAIQSAICALPQTTIQKYVDNIYKITGIDPNCECGCDEGVSQPLVPTSIINGQDGQDGNMIYSGSGAPSGNTGNVNDYYIDTNTGNYYKKTGASTWTFLFNTVGPAGAPGPAGANNASVLYNNFSDATTSVTGNFDVLDKYVLPGNKLVTNGDLIHIHTCFYAIIYGYAVVRVKIGGVVVGGGFLNKGVSNLEQVNIDVYVSRTTGYNGNYETTIVTKTGNDSIPTVVKPLPLGTITWANSKDIVVEVNQSVANFCQNKVLRVTYYAFGTGTTLTGIQYATPFTTSASVTTYPNVVGTLYKNVRRVYLDGDLLAPSDWSYNGLVDVLTFNITINAGSIVEMDYQ